MPQNDLYTVTVKVKVRASSQERAEQIVLERLRGAEGIFMAMANAIRHIKKGDKHG